MRIPPRRDSPATADRSSPRVRIEPAVGLAAKLSSRRPPRSIVVPTLLFAATCYSTWYVGGLVYAAALMSILMSHEAGHYYAARQRGIASSLPWFIPMPWLPLGTMGAILRMRARGTDNRGLFDVASAGPLCGLPLALLYTLIGLDSSQTVPASVDTGLSRSLWQHFVERVICDLPVDIILIPSPLTTAGAIGIFITALNLLPIGQLDGGHIAFSMLPKYAHQLSLLCLAALSLLSLVWQLWHWLFVVVLMLLFGLRHPPLDDGHGNLGAIRLILGSGLLLLAIIGFTPVPPGLPTP